MKEGNEKGPAQKITRRKFLSNAGMALSGVALNSMLPKPEVAVGSAEPHILDQSLAIKGAENLKGIIPPEHLELYIKKIFPKIVSHLAEIQKRLGKKEYDVDPKNLYHVHLYFDKEFDDPIVGTKLVKRENDITYLYHAKELMKDKTKRNIFIDNKGRFEARDGDGDASILEGREIVAIYFADSLEEFEGLLNERKSFFDKNSLSRLGDIYFAVSNLNYQP